MSQFIGKPIRGNPTTAMKNTAPANVGVLKTGTIVKTVKVGDQYLIEPCAASELNLMIGIVFNDGSDELLASQIADGKVNIAIGGDATMNARLAIADQTPQNLAKIGLNIESDSHTDFLENDCKTNVEGIRINLGAATNPAIAIATTKK